MRRNWSNTGVLLPVHKSESFFKYNFNCECAVHSLSDEGLHRNCRVINQNAVPIHIFVVTKNVGVRMFLMFCIYFFIDNIFTFAF